MPKDLRGQRFGKLIVQSLEVDHPYSRRSWRCKCDCGNECVRLESSLFTSLRDNATSSCGCLQKKNLVPGDRQRCIKAGQHRKDAFVNGSNTQLIFRTGTVSTNTSGVQGVSWQKNLRKWYCYVTYQNHRWSLGYCEELVDAIKIRKLAEEAIKENRFNEFYNELRNR